MTNHHRPARVDTPHRTLETGDDVTRQNVDSMRRLENAAMALHEATRPESLVEQIEDAYRQDSGQPPRSDKGR